MQKKQISQKDYEIHKLHEKTAKKTAHFVKILWKTLIPSKDCEKNVGFVKKLLVLWKKWTKCNQKIEEKTHKFLQKIT